MRCTQCGKENSKDARVCVECGAVLTIQNSTEATITFSPVEDTEKEALVDVKDTSEEAVLVVKSGASVGQRFPLRNSEIALGRDPQSDIFLGDITVSRKHAKVTADESTVKVKDVGSLNGTYVNGKRVEEQVLKHGDELQIGKFKLIFLEARS